ncbi:hypothetical protein BLNAU_20257 [Blattamonas nauphoetae]|uniref:Protein kinase domain-containing protein n=1 Tax=Blattamonas nauphoetae TaxID=2049346 RepID=A0ABQ9WZ89_9EUKA|nr:hypothetical protein BLNAU_20257 [Blattamonas nauphoetae]
MLVFILTHFTLFVLSCPHPSSSLTTPSASRQPLSPLAAVLQLSPNAELRLNRPIFLPRGGFHTQNLEVDSLTLSLMGNSTSLHPTQQTRLDEVYGKSVVKEETLFRVTNSTVNLIELSLVVVEWDGSVASLSSSTASVESCKIESNIDNCAFLLVDSDFGGSSIVFRSCRHSSTSNYLRPLVGSSRSSRMERENLKSQKRSNRVDGRWSHTIVGFGMDLNSCELIGGTGPLFSMDGDSTIVVLAQTRMRNMTASSRSSPHLTTPSMQNIVGCEVTESTNHLSGTCVQTEQSGGSLLCSNTTFSSCLTSLTPSTGPPTFTLQHFSTPTTLTSSAALQNFTRCTFIDCSTSAVGGAISSVSKDTSLSISESSFLRCSAPINTLNGGAIYYRPAVSSNSFIVASSTFMRCSSYAGGSFYGSNCFDVSISNCFFHLSSSSLCGGAIDISYRSAPILFTNSVFSECSTGTNGGAIHVNERNPISLKSLLFRKCETLNNGHGHDLSLYNTGSSVLPSSNFDSCESTSKTPNTYLSLNSAACSLIPKTKNTVDLEWMKCSVSTIKDAITLKVSKVISGTMMMLVSNENGYDAFDEHSPPAAPRLLSFPFASSDESTITVGIRDTEVLQERSTYSVLSAAIYDSDVMVGSTSFVTPSIPRIHSISCRIGSGVDHGWVKMVGQRLVSGRYSVTLKGVTNFALDMTFEEGEGIQESTEMLIKLFGEGSKLKLGDDYEVESVTQKDTSTQIRLDPSTITLTIPTAPAITKVGSIEFTDSTKKVVSIELIGHFLSSSPLVVTLQHTTLLTKVNVTMVASNSENGKAEGVVFGSEGKEVELLFGGKYEIVGGRDSSNSAILFSAGLFVDVPKEPARVMSMKGDADGVNWVVITVTGFGLSEGVEYELKLDGTDLSDELVKHSAIVKVRGGLSGSEIVWRAELYPLDATNPNQLRFGYCYCVEGQGGLVVEDGVSFSTPFEKARIEGVSGVVLSGDRTRAIVTFSGRAFEGSMGKGRVSKEDVTWDSLSGLVIVDRTTCKGEFSAGLVESERELEYKSEYKVVGVDGGNYVVEEDVKVVIPAAPIVKSALASITPSTNHHFTVSLTGENLPESGEFTAQFEGVTETVPITFSSRVGSTSSAIDLKTGSEFEFASTYELVALWNEETGEHILCNGVTMTTPDPPLLVKISNEVLSSEALVCVKVTLTVSGMTAEKYTLEVCDVADSSNRRIELSVEFVSTGETSVVVEFEVYGSSKVGYGKTYKVVGMWSSKVRAVVGEGVEFTIPSSPVRIESAKCDLFGSKTDATITLFGVGFPGGTDFWIGIQEWDEKTTAGVGSVIRLDGKISGIGNQSSCVVMGSVFGVVDPELKYETRFVIVSLEMVDTESFVNENVGFSVPAGPPRLTSLSLLSYSKDEKIAVFSAGSSDTSPNEQFVVSVTSDTPPLSHNITLTFPTASNGEGRGILFAGEGETADLEYGVLYRVTGVKDTLDNVIPFVPGLSFETMEEPTRLTRIIAPLSFSADQTRLLIGVTGRRLDTSKEYVVEMTDSADSSSASNVTMNHTLDGWRVSAVVFGESVDLTPTHSYCVSGFFESGSSTSLFFESISFIVPEPPTITAITAHFSSEMNTSVIVEVEGKHLPTDSSYIIHLKQTSITLPLTFSSDATGETEPISLIRSGGLWFNELFEVEKIALKSEPAVQIPFVACSFGPFSSPTDLTIFADSTGSTDELSFGSASDPAKSVGLVFSVLEELRVRKARVCVMVSAEMEIGLDVSSMRLELRNDVIPHPTLRLRPSRVVEGMVRGTGTLEMESLTIEGSDEWKERGVSLVWMSGGFVEMKDVIVKWIESSSPLLSLSSLSLALFSDISFRSEGLSVFARVSNTSNMTLKSCSLTGSSSSPPSASTVSHTRNEGLCSWSGGVIELLDTDLDVISCQFEHLRQGGISMRNGRVEIHSSSFAKNVAGESEFPSVGQNIVCRGSGSVVIESLSGGDGTREHRNGWIVLEDESVFFVPILSRNEKGAERDKVGKEFRLSVTGEFLIPCGLWLEVFSIWEKKEHSTLPIALSESNTVDWAETSLVVRLTDAELNSLESKMEWRARLVFGEDELSGRKKSAVFDSQSVDSSADHRIECGSGVVDGCVKKKENEKKVELNEMDEAALILKMEVREELRGEEGFSSANMVKIGENSIVGDESNGMEEKGIRKGESEVVETRRVIRFGEDKETTIVFRNDTLFNRLHKVGGERGRMRKEEKEKIARELVRLVNSMRKNLDNLGALTRISPHTILLDRDNTVMLETREGAGVGEGTERNQNENEMCFFRFEPLCDGHEGKRWQAPELRENGGIDVEKAAVFSLGLVFWEMETETVPFCEVDSTNAQRLLGLGFGPSTERGVMDSMGQLVEKCLCLKVESRIGLNELVEALDSTTLFSDTATLMGEDPLAM